MAGIVCANSLQELIREEFFSYLARRNNSKGRVKPYHSITIYMVNLALVNAIIMVILSVFIQTDECQMVL